MKKTPLAIIVALLAALAGAGITWAVIHARLPNTTGLDDAFYALIVKEPHTVPNVDKFKDALTFVQHNGQQEVSYCFQLDPEEKPLEYGPQATPCQNVSHPNMPALTHRIYAVSPWDIGAVAIQIGEKATPTPPPTPTPTP